MPGVSMTQPAAGSRPRVLVGGATRSEMLDDDVCRPRPVTAFTTPVARPRLRHEHVHERRLADARVADGDRRAAERAGGARSRQVLAAPAS